MAIGTGIILLVLGLVLALHVVHLNIPHVADGALATILIIAGVLALVLSLVAAGRGGRHTQVTERRRA
jgi:hypothetical protein